jgi:hypothetical protein
MSRGIEGIVLDHLACGRDFPAEHLVELGRATSTVCPSCYEQRDPTDPACLQLFDQHGQHPSTWERARDVADRDPNGRAGWRNVA